MSTDLDENGFRYSKRCKIEREHPNLDWERTWGLSCMSGLESERYTFLWRLVHNILPTQDRLCRILVTVTSPSCLLCDSQQHCNLQHALFSCSFNNNVGQWLLKLLNGFVPQVTAQQVILLDLNLDQKHQLPLVWLIANTLSIIWKSRIEKKATNLFTTRATLEANIMLLRKTRYSSAAELIQNLLSRG